MPIYEYVSESDGAVIELLRPMADADKPVPDPDGKGRVFKRRHSTFATGATASTTGSASRSLPQGGCCPCGKSAGACSRN